MGITLANNAHTTLAANISSTDTTIYVDDVDSFPALDVGDYFYCTLESTTGTIEIVKVTQVNAASFNVVRAQENTIAVPFNIGARVELRLTVQNLEDQFASVASTYVSDAAYAGSWDGVTTVAPSKNAVRDKFASVDAAVSAAAAIIADGDKGDVTISGNGTVWTVDVGAVTQNDVSGLATSDSPQFAAVNVSHATANTLTGSGGDLFVEGNRLFRAGGTDVPVADGGTGASNAVDAQANLGLRRNLTGNLSLTYDPGGGADFTTLASAVAYIQTLDPRGFDITVTGPAITTAVTERLIIPQDFGWATNEQYEPNIHFNLANCDFTNATDSCIAVIGGRVKVTTKSIACASATYAAVQCADMGELYLVPGSFGASTTGHIQAANGTVYLPSAYTIAGGALYHALAEVGRGHVEFPAATVTLTGTPAFSRAFVECGENSYIAAHSVTFSGAATGKRFIITGSGNIAPNDPNDNLNALFPGDANGTIEVRSTTVRVENGANASNLVSVATSSRTHTLQDGTGTIYQSGGIDVALADGGTGASDAATARTNLGVGTGDSPTFTSVTLASSAAGNLLTLRSTDAGSTNGPSILIDRNSSSPANNDNLGLLSFRGRDSAAGLVDYATIASIISDATNGSEDGILELQAIVNGANAAHLRCTGGNVTTPGTVTVNNGTAIPAGGDNTLGVKATSTNNFGVFFGSGAPTLSAAKGSLYLRSDGSTTNDRMYVNTNGGTTWTAVVTVA